MLQRTALFALVLVTVFFSLHSPAWAKKSYQYKDVLKDIEANTPEIIAVSDSIWRSPETALKESVSSALIRETLKKHGFSIQSPVADIPTAFVAVYGSGSPVIGVLGEFDALPGLSQKAVSHKEPAVEGGAGHGCGHNVFGAASMGAAIAIRQAMEKQSIKGTVKFFGCPAEETVVGKVFMARAGVFNGLDVCLDWHPSDENQVNIATCQAMNNVIFTFYGKTAHSASDPWKGRSALDGVELMNAGVNMLREHTLLTNRMHYVITNGGGAPNVVPALASVWYFVRGTDRAAVDELFPRVVNCAQGAALATGTTYSLQWNSAVYGVLVNMPAARVMYENLKMVGAPRFTPEEQKFAQEIQKNFGIKEQGLDTAVKVMGNEILLETGSTDVAEVSWNTPVVSLNIAAKPMKVAGHSWGEVACAGMSIGHKSAVNAAQVLALTGLDFMTSPADLKKAREEFTKSTGGKPYKSALPDSVKVKLP